MPCGNYSVDYLHMGRFFQYLMFRHPVVKQVCLCVCVCMCARVYHKHEYIPHVFSGDKVRLPVAIGCGYRNAFGNSLRCV
jgi:hypothetical protein